MLISNPLHNPLFGPSLLVVSAGLVLTIIQRLGAAYADLQSPR
jgi:hypothetical protein